MAREYRSIGEVLVGLKAEFPDITISKIRFLESEGLVSPERTSSGYRKFHEPDVARLRAILKAQRDEYLPLKVIKEKLEREDAVVSGSLSRSEMLESPDELAEPPSGLQMSLDEITAATGVDPEHVAELEAFGLVCSHGPEGARFYDGDDYMVLTVAQEFFHYGVQAKNLQMYKHFAQREADLFEQIVRPTLRQRNPEARRSADSALAELSKASRKLKQALLRIRLKDHLSAGQGSMPG